MGFFDRFRKQPQSAKIKEHTIRPHIEIEQSRYGNKKYSWGAVKPGSTLSYEDIRNRARAIYRDSTIAHGIVQRLVDNVINTGLTFESGPEWDLLPFAPKGEKARYKITQNIETLFSIYVNSKESDLESRLTFNQLQRLIYRLLLVDGEVFIVLRYLNSPKRTSPLSIQLIQPEQVISPYGADLTTAESRGGYIEDGIEFDATGQRVAIWVQERLGQRPIRMPFYGPKSGRKFIIHLANFESAGQTRGFPELESLAYELSRLTEYDIAELEAVVASSTLLGSVESDKDALPGKGPKINPGVSFSQAQPQGPNPGIETVHIGEKAIVMNNMYPGYSMKLFQPTRPNPNYSAFVEAFESRLAGALGMPRSVLLQQFNGSYSAARGEIKFFWHTVDRRRDDFIAGFLQPFFECWFTEQVKNQEIIAQEFDVTKRKYAWLAGTWHGISMPQIDPLKEVNAISKRLDLGHTTGEREAKNYNGSDIRSNLEKLQTENRMIKTAIGPLHPELNEVEENEENENNGN